jgi:hypothetical protein
MYEDAENMQALLSRGEVFPGRPSQLREGIPIQCHANVSSIWVDDQERLEVATGYALCAENVWRRHSWVMDGQTVIETTHRWQRYFGYRLTFVESVGFACWAMGLDHDDA